ncbi:MAG: hypothetical protein ACJ8F7_13715 [Gemmataceae bacterium]
MQSLRQKLAEWRPTSPGRSTFAHQDAASGWSATLDVEKADALSCELWALTLAKVPAPAPLTVAELRDRAAAVAGRTTGLLETLRVVEVDAQRGEALLRSDAPTVRNEKRSHYELNLTAGNRATLRRFQAPAEPAGKREQVGFVLTHEVLSNLVDDLAAALA